MKLLQTAIALSVFTSSVLLGATLNITDVEKEVQVPKEVQPKQESLIDISGVKKYAPAMKDDQSGQIVLIKGFKFENATQIDDTILLGLVSSYANKQLDFNEIQELALMITKEYRDQGYFVARAYLPVQDINANNGILIISIIEGSYGKFSLSNNSLVKNSVVQGLIENAKTRGNVISTNTLERAMLLVNDLPGAVVSKANILPGEVVGSSNFDIETQATSQFDGYLLTDNAGSKYTGKYRLMAGINANSLFGYGDKISLSGLVSNGTDLTNARLVYNAPLASNGLRGELSYSHTEYSLVDLDGTADDRYTGISNTLEGKLSYPIIRERDQNLYTNITLGRKVLNDKLDSDLLNPRDNQYIKLALDYDVNYATFGKATSSGLALSLTHGDISFDKSSDRTTDENGADTNGNYTKVNLNLSHTINFTQNCSLESNLSLQYALNNKNLDGIEDMSIGGSNGVKLYPSGESSAENGYLFNIEAKYKLPQIIGINNSVGIFYDAGRVHMADNITNFDSRILQDVGIGYYANHKDFFGKVQAAWKVGNEDVTSEPNRDSKVLFQLGMIF